jgi:hypothetical protein
MNVGAMFLESFRLGFDFLVLTRTRFAGERFRSGLTKGRKSEGASTVSLNHPLAANSREAGEQCGNFNTCS